MNFWLSEIIESVLFERGESTAHSALSSERDKYTLANITQAERAQHNPDDRVHSLPHISNRRQNKAVFSLEQLDFAL